MSMRWSLPLAFTLTLAACANAPQPSEPAPAPAPVAQAPAKPVLGSGIFLQNFDKSVRAQDDFYRFVNGTWLAQTEIPADKNNYGSFGILQDEAEKNLHAIAEEAAKADAPAGSDAQLVGDFYESYMDEAKAESLGLAPLQPELDRIAAIKDRALLEDYLARAQLIMVDNPIGAQIFADAKNPEVNTLWAFQGGFGLPERDYYFSKEKRFEEIRAAYVEHIEQVFTLAGRKDAAAVAKKLMAFETKLAQASWPAVRLREIEKLYNPVTVAAAEKATPGIDWSEWFADMGIGATQQFVLAQPDYFKAVGKAIQQESLATWRDYLTLRTIDTFSPYLSSAFVQENFDFYARTLSGTPELKPRWKRALGELEMSTGDLLGKEYVKRHFPPEAKQRMDVLVANLLKAFDVSIDELEWMGPETREQAHEKVRSFTVKIGYPTKWKEYPGLVTKSDDLLGNVLRARDVNVQRELAKVGQPVDKTEWGMTPQTVNAYYNPLANEIVFPAAILQPPFFDMNADDAVNYGGIGAVIGHEISHGFDDQGRKFDGKGVLRDWWKADDNDRFMVRANALVKQYDAFSPLPGMNVNGQLTLGENIGDLSGLAVAYKAYQISLNGQPAQTLDGFTGDQRFFIGWGQVWARKYRDDELRKRLKTDPHSPSEYRCNGILRNMPAFTQAFDVKAGDGMFLPADQRVRIW
ncbi:MAG TPA: M13-type metalloendopeptidase [Steroidobacteraceae bacterium]|nr:M13-type metalloendopeptidase [Steroidobacteraceae bacterium]